MVNGNRTNNGLPGSKREDGDELGDDVSQTRQRAPFKYSFPVVPIWQVKDDAITNCSRTGYCAEQHNAAANHELMRQTMVSSHLGSTAPITRVGVEFKSLRLTNSTIGTKAHYGVRVEDSVARTHTRALINGRCCIV